MPLFDDNHVKISGCIVVWDGMNNPDDPNDNGNVKRSLKVVIPPNNPDINVLQQLANNELQQSEFKGVLPQGGYMPIGVAGPQEFNGMYPGYAVVNCSTFRMPDVYIKGQLVADPMRYLPMIYSGQVVDVLVHCKAYNNKSKGVAARLDGFEIMVDANAPRQNFGGGGIDTSGAFGGGQVQQQNNQQFQQPTSQHNNWGGQPGNGPGGTQPEPYQQQPQGYQPQGGPNQAHNYMPGSGNNNGGNWNQ